ncbi:MAG TPA: 16S rRNA (adenine(1518)-N(6)/adenine(1519)-N(6))-dimethyltransferase RsmA [Thermoanaerobaculia bacterium]
MPKKKWGQNFLRNQAAVQKIIAAIEPEPDESIVEIGPGEGVLTEKLALLDNEVTAIEIDPELAARLRQRFGDKVGIRNEDALEGPLPGRPYRAVGNLPYNVGTPILRRVIADPNLRRAVFMLQKEVAQRLVAKPNDEQYGFLTLYTQMFASARILMTLGPGSFHPAPKVDSAVVVLDPRPVPQPADGVPLIDLISAAFRMRRKKLVNNLTEWPRDVVLRALREADIDENARAETLTLDQFAHLAARLKAAR